VLGLTDAEQEGPLDQIAAALDGSFDDPESFADGSLEGQGLDHETLDPFGDGGVDDDDMEATVQMVVMQPNEVELDGDELVGENDGMDGGDRDMDWDTHYPDMPDGNVVAPEAEDEMVSEVQIDEGTLSEEKYTCNECGNQFDVPSWTGQSSGGLICPQCNTPVQIAQPMQPQQMQPQQPQPMGAPTPAPMQQPQPQGAMPPSPEQAPLPAPAQQSQVPPQRAMMQNQRQPYGV
jgi:DNA-directed RNA polymerase subunit RPC12/RpoP